MSIVPRLTSLSLTRAPAAALDHKHIVRLVGVCEGDRDARLPFMLVLELGECPPPPPPAAH